MPSTIHRDAGEKYCAAPHLPPSRNDHAPTLVILLRRDFSRPISAGNFFRQFPASCGSMDQHTPIQSLSIQRRVGASTSWPPACCGLMSRHSIHPGRPDKRRWIHKRSEWVQDTSHWEANGGASHLTLWRCWSWTGWESGPSRSALPRGPHP